MRYTYKNNESEVPAQPHINDAGHCMQARDHRINISNKTQPAGGYPTLPPSSLLPISMKHIHHTHTLVLFVAKIHPLIPSHYITFPISSFVILFKISCTPSSSPSLMISFSFSHLSLSSFVPLPLHLTYPLSTKECQRCDLWATL